MTAYYNEIDPQKAAWLRELIKRNLIVDGEVDERSIEDVLPADVAGFRQCHWFAGIGIWSYALRQAGWSDDRRVWTASCPCQPFSTAGKGKGIADERHLWPAFYHIASVCKPDVVFGEQVASKDGLAWLDTVQSDMEAMAYAFGPLVIPAAGVGAPHIRHRIFFVAHSTGERRRETRTGSGRPAQWIGDGCESGSLGNTEKPGDRRNPGEEERTQSTSFSRRQDEGDWLTESLTGSAVSGMENPDSRGFEFSGTPASNGTSGGEPYAEFDGQAGVVDDASRAGLQRYAGNVDNGNRPRRLRAFAAGSVAKAGPVNGFWQGAEWVYCRPEPRYPEGSYRAVEPGTFPLVNGASERVGLLRGYGDGIVAEVAKEFIKAYMDTCLTN